MNVGYVRVSTVEQDTALQRAAMAGAGVVTLFEEKKSSVVERPVLEQCLRSLVPGDVLCVYKIDRLARSLYDLMGLLRRLDAMGCSFRSLTEPIETATAAGRLMVQILGSFAEFERAVIRERCSAGRAAARAKGVTFGRPVTLERSQVIAMREAGKSFGEIAKELGYHKSSVVRCFDGNRVTDGGNGQSKPRKPAYTLSPSQAAVKGGSHL